jgi:hypothetical protein
MQPIQSTKRNLVMYLFMVYAVIPTPGQANPLLEPSAGSITMQTAEPDATLTIKQLPNTCGAL